MIKFGTGGWRAIIGDEFIKSNIQKLCQVIANKVDQNGVVIGFDRRFLSDKAAVWAAEVFAGNDVIVHLINESVPTPTIMYAAQRYDTEFSMAITASHNSGEYNGIKLFTRGGRDAVESVTEEIEDLIPQLTDVKVMDYQQAQKRGLIHIINPINDYIDTIIDKIDMKKIRQADLRILIDPMYGVSRTSLQTILLSARCKVDTINDRHDTLFGGKLPSPSSATLHKLKNMVVDKGYDLGIATDGDADRIGIIDKTGRFIHPNEILALLYYYFLEYKGWKGSIVRNISTTHLLDKIAQDYNEVCYEVPVGFKYISSKMEETDSLIGGESSGGLTIRGHIHGKDGIFAASLLVELLAQAGKPFQNILDEIYRKYGNFKMVEHEYRFSLDQKQKLITKLFEIKNLPAFSKTVSKISYEDGLKVYFEDDSWISVRFSGTEPLLRVFAEASNEVEAEELVKTMEDFMLDM